MFKSNSFIVRLTLVFLTIFTGVFIISAIVLGIKWNILLSRGLDVRGQLALDKITASLNHLIARSENISEHYYHLLEKKNFTHSPENNDAYIFSLLDGYHHEASFNKNDAPNILIGVYNESGESGEKWKFYYRSISLPDEIREVQSHEILDNSINWSGNTLSITKKTWVHNKKLLPDSSLSSLYLLPVRSQANASIKAFLAVEIPVSLIRDHIHEIEIKDNAFCRIYDSNDQLILEASSDQKELDPHIQDIHAQLDKYSRDHPSQKTDRLNDIRVYHDYCRNGWNIYTYMSDNWVKERLLNLFYYVMVIFMMTVPLVVLLSFFLTKKITTPLTKLSQAAEAIGNGQFNIKLPQYHGSDEIGLLTRSFENMQQELKIYVQELKKSFKRQETITSELNIAKTIQSGILPKIESVFIGEEPFDLEALLIPAKAVGGDLYDFFFVDERHLVLIIGDVSGKGIPAAMFMSVTQTLQRSITFRFKQPADIVAQLNKMLLNNNDATMFVTYFIAVIDTCSGKMDYCNAGHNFPIIRKNNGDLKTLGEQHGLPLGIYEDDYSSGSLVLEPNDSLILYTDGITETFNSNQELFGEIRLKEAISYAMSPNPHKIARTILDHIEIFAEGSEQSDDITLVVFQMLDYYCPIPSLEKED